MPYDRSKYPDDWEAISQRIRFERAGGKCERCGVPHGALIVRSTVDKARYIVWNADRLGYDHSDGRPIRLSEIPSEFDTSQPLKKVVLTTAHIHNPDPMDCRDENLMALCQRCHNHMDAKHRAQNAAQTRRANRAKAQADTDDQTGQARLFEV